jgi:hypothetical protein
MFKGEGNNSNSESNYKLYTGLGEAEIVAINPTTKEFEEITGYPRNLSYEKIKFGDQMAQPLRFLTYNEDAGYVLLDIMLVNAERISQSGKKQFISSKGHFSFADDANAISSNPKMEWFGTPIRSAFINEDIIVTLIKNLYGIDDREGDFFVELMAQGYDYEQLYNGNIQLLKTLFSYARDKGYKVFLPYAVRETVTEDKKPKNYQTILTKDAHFYSSLSYGIKNLQKSIETRNPSYNLTVTSDFQEFVPKDVFSSESVTEDIFEGF